MVYCVYKITNKINGKSYIGKRKHHDPYKDKYMGSGKQIKAAIKKYGIDAFYKDITSIFNTNEEAAKLEAALVTREYISSGLSYNMHEGGHGGFAHLNDGSEEHKKRSRRAGIIAAKKSSSHPNWGKYNWVAGDKRTKDASIKGNSYRKIHGLSAEHKNKIREAAKRREELRRITNYYQRDGG